MDFGNEKRSSCVHDGLFLAVDISDTLIESYARSLKVSQESRTSVHLVQNKRIQEEDSSGLVVTSIHTVQYGTADSFAIFCIFDFLK